MSSTKEPNTCLSSTALPLQVNITTVIQSQLAETSIVYHVINRDNVTREVWTRCFPMIV